MAAFTINGESVQLDADPNTPLLWVVREHLKLTGTKFGCGVGQCGACTVHIDGSSTYSCMIPISAVEGKKITTIEGLSNPTEIALKEAWINEAVPQCGYCQSGQILTAVALLSRDRNPSLSTFTSNLFEADHNIFLLIP